VTRFRFLLISPVLLLASCGDDCSSYSEYSCKQIENADYNVFFFLGDREERLGQVKGLAQCGAVARAQAARRELRSSQWSYVCCMIAKGSSCYEKHR
jgi:hypothetical protein